MRGPSAHPLRSRTIEHRPADRPPGRGPQAKRFPPAGDISGMSDEARILLVDQSRGALLFQETLLRRRESVVSTAMTASEALARAISEQPKLIIFGYDLFDM